MKRPLATSIAAVTVAPLLLLDLQTNAGIVGRAYLFAPIAAVGYNRVFCRFRRDI